LHAKGTSKDHKNLNKTTQAKLKLKEEKKQKVQKQGECLPDNKGMKTFYMKKKLIYASSW